MRLASIEPGPAPLPVDLLVEEGRRRRLLLMLDYDGTISAITPNLFSASPLPNVREILARLCDLPSRISVAVLSGRPISWIAKLLKPDRRICLAGIHGLELRVRGTRRWLIDPAPYGADLARVRRWLAAQADQSLGFVVEDKVAAIALHYRLADSSSTRELVAQLNRFVALRTQGLAVRAGKKVVEVMPQVASKASAAREFIRLSGASLPVYFGDDETDEEVFALLRRRGIGIRVGRSRKTFASYRVPGPAAVVNVLEILLQSLEQVADRASG